MAFQPHDVVPDSPLNNFATLNPLFVGYASRNNYVSNNGNLQIKDLQLAQSTFTIPEDGRSYYMEAFVDLASNDGELFIRNQLTTAWSYNSSASQSIGLYYSNGSGGFTGGFVPRENGVIKSPITIIGTPHSNSWDLYPYEVVFGVLVSKTNRTLSVQFYANNTLVYQNNSFNFNDDAPAVIAFAGANVPSGKFSVINFGQDHTFGGNKTGGGGYQDANGIGQFHYQPPAGALALCTKNIPSGPIDIANDDVPSDYFKAVTWTGNGTNSGRSISSVPFKPDFVWAKNRTNGYSHLVYDSVRGVGSTAELTTSGTDIQGGTTSSERGYLNTFDANGFSSVVGSNGDNLYFNENNSQFVAWCWKAAGAPADGGSSVAGSARIVNEDGTQADTTCAALASAAGANITPSKVSANRKSGFSIIKWNNGAAGNKTLPHGLTNKPDMVFFKGLAAAQGWFVYHNGLTDDSKYLYLHDAFAESYLTQNTRVWGGRYFDNNVISFESGYTGSVNENYIAYCWHSVAGYSKISSYVGNGDADGPYVECGFRPAWVMWKRTDVSNNWIILDTARDINNVAGKSLYPNQSHNELAYDRLDLLSNGFKLRQGGAGWLDQNASGGTYIFAAFAEAPMNAPSNAR